MKNRRGDTVTRRHGDRITSPRVTASPRLRVSSSLVRLITLLTDFGTQDYFVAAVKGVILDANPDARIVDITHDIPPHDIEAAAFTLLAAHSSFSSGTIHIAVVDPGVGSSRRPILIKAQNQFFVGPDNGIFSYVLESSADSGKKPEIFHLNNTKYFRQPVSPTFNGRDVFAPVAAALSKGVKPNELGIRITDFIRLPSLKPLRSRDGKIPARIIHIDRFGNCVTNITRNELTAEMIDAGAKLRLKGKLVKSFREYFTEETGDSDKVFGVWGSAGFLEIAMRTESAAKLLKARRGDSIVMEK